MNPTLARLRRILVMVPWLLDHPGVAVDDVAERFGVTPGEVIDDLDVLGYCGLPGYGGGDLIEASVSGGQVVVRMAEFFARPLALSMRESLSLLLAARATRDSGILGDDPTAGPLAAAIVKLEAHMGADAALPVAVDVGAGGADLLARLWPAVTDRRVVVLTYVSASKAETTVREVEPWRLRRLGGAWYLQGHCRLAGAERSFRLDRIRELEVTALPAPDPPDTAIPPPTYRPAADDPQVVIEVAPDAAWIADHIVLDATSALDDGWVRLEFRAATLDWAARLLLRLGDRVRGVDPPGLAAQAHQMAQDALVRYRAPGDSM